MNLSPSQVQEVIELTARILADRIEEKRGAISECVVFDLKTSAQLVGLSTKQIPQYLPIVKTANGKHGVTIGAIRKHIEGRTIYPDAKPRSQRIIKRGAVS